MQNSLHRCCFYTVIFVSGLSVNSPGVTKIHLLLVLLAPLCKKKKKCLLKHAALEVSPKRTVITLR